MLGSLTSPAVAANDALSLNSDSKIGIGGTVARPPLPRHRTCGSASGGSVSWARLLRCHPETLPVLLRSGLVLPYCAVRKHLGAVGE